MTDKIDPGWISDRLPTKEDIKEEGDCLYYYIPEKDYLYFCSWDYVEDGWYWAKAEGMTFHILQVSPEILKTILKPEECLAREQENSNECGECGQEWEGDGDCPVCSNGKDTLEKDWQILIRYEKEIKELAQSLSLAELGWKQEEEESNKLRQALAESKEDSEFDHKEYKRLRNELKEKLAKSEEELKEYKRFFKQQVSENTELKKLLVKEWVSKMKESGVKE